MNTNINLLCIVLIGVVLSGSGCSTLRLTNENTVQLLGEVKKLRSEVDSLSTLLDKNFTVLRYVRADQQVRFDEIERRIEGLNGEIQESQLKLSKIDIKTQKMKDGLEEKMKADSMSVFRRSSEAESMLELGMNDFNSGRYADALMTFTDITKIYPDVSKVNEEAFFRIAETRYYEKKYEDALSAYKEYLGKFSSGSFVCQVLYKMWLVYDVTKKTDQRDVIYAQIESQCRDSKELLLIKSRLGQ